MSPFNPFLPDWHLLILLNLTPDDFTRQLADIRLVYIVHLIKDIMNKTNKKILKNGEPLGQERVKQRAFCKWNQPFVFANGISLRVETRTALLDEEHLINETVEFSLALFSDCLVYEMLFIEQCSPSLDTQTDSICENKRQMKVSKQLVTHSIIYCLFCGIKQKDHEEEESFLIPRPNWRPILKNP